MPIPRDLAIYLLLFCCALGIILPVVFGWTKKEKAPESKDPRAE